jgi:hypothetical protein
MKLGHIHTLVYSASMKEESILDRIHPGQNPSWTESISNTIEASVICGGSINLNVRIPRTPSVPQAIIQYNIGL